MLEREAADIIVRAIEGGAADEVLEEHRARTYANVGSLLALEKRANEVFSAIVGRECSVGLTIGSRSTPEENDVYNALRDRYARAR